MKDPKPRGLLDKAERLEEERRERKEAKKRPATGLDLDRIR